MTCSTGTNILCVINLLPYLENLCMHVRCCLQPTSAASINGHSPALATAARASGGRVKPGHSQGVQKAQQVVDSSERAISSPHWDIPSPQRGIRSSPRGVPGPHQDAVVRDTRKSYRATGKRIDRGNQTDVDVVASSSSIAMEMDIVYL